jgi:flagellar biosynthesis protein FlhG
MDQAQKLRESFRKAGAAPPPVDLSNTPKKNGVSCTSIAITSGKGGVGKSNICLSLGIMLAKLKKKVLIFDADLGLANIHLLLGIAPSRTLFNFVNKECSLRDVVSLGPEGLSILPASSGLEAMANLDAVQLGLLVRDLTLLEQDYDFLMVDTGAGIGRIATEFASAADKTLLVVTPEPTSLADAYAMVKVLFKKKELSVSVLVNMASSDKEGKETFDRLNALVVKFLCRPLNLLGILPLDKQVPRFVRRQSSLALDTTRSPFGARISQCARMLSGCSVTRKENFFSRILASAGKSAYR